MRSIVLGTLGVIAVALAISFAIYSIYFLIGYGMQRRELKISMDSFMSFYVIAPEKWELNEMFVSYKKDFLRINWFEFSFNLIDTIKYERWRKRKERREEKQRILVSNDNVHWYRKHFAKYKNGEIHAWNGGQTSYTTDTAWHWEYAKLAEVE